MTCSVKNVVQWSKCWDKLCVDPELIEGPQLLVDHSVAGRHQQGQGQVERLLNMQFK